MEIYLDTETIDVPENREGDLLFQLAFITKDIDGTTTLHNSYRLPPNYNEMSIEVMETTGVTPERLETLVIGSEFTKHYNLLHELISHEENVLYIHNAKFDLEILRRIDLEPKCKVICTLRVANVLNDLLKLPFKSTRLSYLHYYYRNDRNKKVNINFHSAEFDCLCLMELVNYWKENINFDIETAVRITNNPINYTYCHFGKNRGTLWSDMSRGQLKYFYELGDADIQYTIDNLF